MGKVCSIFGDTSGLTIRTLDLYVKDAIQVMLLNGVDTFLFESFVGFNRMVYDALEEFHDNYSFKRILCCENEQMIDENYFYNSLEFLSAYFDGHVFYAPRDEVYIEDRMYQRVTDMIDNSDFCLFYLKTIDNKLNGEAYGYAQFKLKKFIRIDECMTELD